MRKFCGSLRREDGQTMAEYGVVLTVTTIAVFGALAYLGGSVAKVLTGVSQFIS
jgi:Flp pilus assembly pilin Flp